MFAVFLVSQGMIQNFKPYTKAKLDFGKPMTSHRHECEKNELSKGETDANGRADWQSR